MSILYEILKAIVKVSLRIYYSKTTFEHRERGYFKNPCIVISNHPSTVMDPLNAVAWIGPQVKFLANASLFKTRFTNWFFSTFYCIKVERYQDTGGKPLNNIKAFEMARKHLEEGKPLFVAPEGGSFPYRELRQIKTGFARIAFDAESSNDFNLGLTILPIGLNYEKPKHFRNEIFTKFGAHIYISDFQKDYEVDPKKAVRKLTDYVSEKLSELLIVTKSREEEELQRNLETILRTEKSLSPSEDLTRSQNLLQKMRFMEKENQSAFEKFRTKTNSYFEKLKNSKISNKTLKNRKVGLLEIPVLIIGFPIFLIGFLTNFFPTFIPGQINKRFNKDESYDSTFKYVSGLVMFPLFYSLQIKLIEYLFEIDFNSLIYFTAFLLTGFFAEHYLKTAKVFFEKIRLTHLNSKDELLKIRTEILEILNFDLPTQSKS